MSSTFDPAEIGRRLDDYPAEALSLYDGQHAAAIHVTSATRGIEKLGEFKNLRYLYASRIRQADFDCVCHASQITHLSANIAAVRSLRAIGDLRGLRALHLFQNSKLKSLSGIENLTKLQYLSLANLAVDIDIGPVTGCTELRFLWLSGTTWTAMQVPSLAPLAPLTKLSWLKTPGVRVKDRSLSALYSLKQLSEVRLSRFPDKELFALAKALPNYDGRLLYSETAHKAWQRKLQRMIAESAA